VTVSPAFRNSMVVSLGTAVVTSLFAVSAAYAYARFRFPGRGSGDSSPSSRTGCCPASRRAPPRFVTLNSIQLPSDERLRETLLAIAYVGTALPFAIWNLKGSIDTLPTDLEQAAMVDGAGPGGAFVDVILPLILPALAVTLPLGFMAGWTEFIPAWLDIGDEVGLAGALPDHFARRTFPWDRPEIWDGDLLGTDRRSYSAGGAYAFVREGDGETVLVATSAGDAAHTADLDAPVFAGSAGQGSELFTLQPAPTLDHRDGRLRLDRPARTGTVVGFGDTRG
jgi:hypothetical protein